VLKNRIRRTAVWSMIFAAVLAPWLCGFLAAFYLTQAQFWEFVWFLMIVKTGLIGFSLYKIWSNDSFIVQSNSFKWVVLVYIAYLGLIWHAVTKSYAWTASHLNVHGYAGLLASLAEYAYADIFINMVIVGLGTWAITSHFLDPKLIRPSYVYEGEEGQRPQSTSP
jgi:hypothetical protein